ncbi:MAG: hypothetical protein HYY87_04010 [Candidatus Levybacteria bacterium]|nr:hypothetical protein [Candidatus Levybacteria bacterium]
MKIFICASMNNVKKMLQVKKKLESLGHNVFLPPGTDECLKDPELIDDLKRDLKYCLENDVMAKGFELIGRSDAILVLNYPKNGVSGYIGASVLMEIAVARYLGKRIILLNGLPSMKKARWVIEVKMMHPEIIKGDFNKLEIN